MYVVLSVPPIIIDRIAHAHTMLGSSEVIDTLGL